MLHIVKRTIVAASVAAVAGACGGGGGSTTTGPTPVFTSVAVSPSSPTVSVGSTITLSAVAKDQNGAVLSAPAATWTSSNEAVATVDGTGVVTGVANGSATITASITSGSITHTGAQSVDVNTPAATAGVTATTQQAFSPPSVTIARAGGTGTVTWTFQSLAHTVTWDSQPSGASIADIDVTHDAHVARDFTVAGHYTYHCSIHPNMHGVVEVQ
jgi:plastocyanin